MGKRLQPHEAELYRRCDEILHYVWDPIGVSNAPAARDEYHSYLPRVFAHVLGESKSSAIAEYLVSVEAEAMGLSPRRDHAQHVAALLLESREWILKEQPK